MTPTEPTRAPTLPSKELDVNQWFIAAAWLALALAAGIISVRLAISVSLLEIGMGVIAGNFLHLQNAEWTNFLASFGAVLLTFMAGAEIDPESLRKHLKPSLAIGFASFLLPFLGALLVARYLLGWDLHASQIAGIALSTTSVAVVYAVMIETGLNRTELGKLILAACFVTDLGTVLALGIIFANHSLWLVAFLAITGAALFLLPRFARWFFSRYGGKVSELEAKFVFLVLFVLGGLAAKANSEAVLPAYLMGLAVAEVFADHHEMVRRLRTTVFALLTPFYFIKAGLLVSLPAVIAGAGLIACLLAVKLLAKGVGVYPLSRVFRLPSREGIYTTLLMSTGLTFGTISALFGYQHGYITQSQYAILVTVVIGSAVIPTLIAQTFFCPAESAPRLTLSPQLAETEETA
jgi:Kef-type K+ transport system membrane component KefB